MRKLVQSFLTLAMLAVAAPAGAGIITYQAVLDSSRIPSSDSPATGFALVTMDDIAHTMLIEMSFTGLQTPVLAAHLHCCNPGGDTALPVVGIPSLPDFPLGATSGSYSHVFDLSLASTYRPSFVAQWGGTAAGAEAGLRLGMAEELAYLGIRTAALPGGEIRGFLTPATATPAAVPEPATLTLVGLGAAALARRPRLNAQQQSNRVS